MRLLAALAFASAGLLAPARVPGAQEAPPREPDETPERLKAWAGKGYTLRYVLRVETPPAFGIGLQPEPAVASVYLPLRVFAPAAAEGAAADAVASQVERVLLKGDEGETVQVFVRPVKGGSEVEVAFPTRPGHRFFCLYAGAPEDGGAESSPVNFQPKAVRVRLHAQEAPPDFRPQPGKPLTRDLFQLLSREAGRPLGQEFRRNVDDPEPEYPPYTEGQSRLPQPAPRPEALLQLSQYVGVYEAFLRAPLSGTYEFALTTFGAACLVLDGKTVLEAGQPDPERAPFALQGRAKLDAGLHRVVVYHAQAGDKPGVRLLWRPPGETDLLSVPAQSFPRAQPAVVRAVEDSADQARAFIHVELLGQYRTGLQRGPPAAREWIWLFAQGTAGMQGGLRIVVAGAEPKDVPAAGGCAWLPAGSPVEILALAPDGTPLPAQAPGAAARRVLFPTEALGARDVGNVTGALALKAAPQFVYPGETAQIHLEAQLSRVPFIVSKERIERGPPLPPPLPMGPFRFTWRLTGLTDEERFALGSAETEADGQAEATPDASGRRKIRIPLDAGKLEEAARRGRCRLELVLWVGGLPAEEFVVRLLHARAAWPGRLCARLEGLEFLPEREPRTPASKEPLAAPAEGALLGGSSPPFERVLVVVPREDEADYRRFRPWGAPGLQAGIGAALFLGDPLVEAASGARPDASIGLAAALAKALPKTSWQAHVLPGPHRGWFIYRLLAEAEAILNRLPGGKAPAVAVVVPGGGDAAKQTPPHDFERGLDVLVDRLRRAGVRRIVVLGVLPEPRREKQGEPYQAAWAEVMRQHHLTGVDLFSLWTQEPNWERRFAVDPERSPTTYGAAPQAAALEEIARLLKEKLE